MENSTYQVIIIDVREGLSRSNVVKNLASLFKTTSEQVEKLLAIPGFVLKKGLTEEIAGKYKAAIEKAGAICRIEKEEVIEKSLEVDLPPTSPISSSPEVISASKNPQFSEYSFGAVDRKSFNENGTSGISKKKNYEVMVFVALGVIACGFFWKVLFSTSPTPTLPIPVSRPTDQSVQTSFGVLSVAGDAGKNSLLLDGKLLPIPDNNNSASLSIIDRYNISNGDAILIGISQGTSCTQFQFVTLNEHKPKVTPVFGTCDDGPQIIQNGDQITLGMLDKDSKPVSFVYHDGVVSPQQIPQSANKVTAGVGSESSKTTNFNVGFPMGEYIYKMADNSSLLTTYYPDGAFVERLFTIDKPSDRPMLISMVVGICHPNDSQLDCRRTGSAGVETAIQSGRLEIDARDFRPINIQTSDIFKTEPDGSYISKQTKRAVNGVSQSVAENDWDKTKYIPTHNINLDNLRAEIPAKYFR